MVHIPGPVISPTRDLNESLERLVNAHPDASIDDLRRLHPRLEAVPIRALAELVAQIRQRAKVRFKPLTTFG